MYRLLLVDDEAEVIEYFHRIFTERSGLPLEVFTARCAQEALDCLNNFRIDVVLSDIKMPRMNGLQMYGVMKERWPHCRVIFLSGVLDFDYVYSSIQERQVRYLTKLEPVDKIIGTVRETLEEIERDYQQSLSIQKTQEQLESALPLLREQCLFNVLNGMLDSVGAAQARFMELGIPLRPADPLWIVGGVFDNSQDELSFRQAAYRLRSISETYFSERYRFACHQSDQKYFVWLLQPTNPGEVKESCGHDVLLTGQLEYIQGACRENLKLTCSFVYVKKPVPFEQLREGFVQIKSALGNKRSLSEASVIFSCGDLTEEHLLWKNAAVLDSYRLLPQMNMLEGYLELGQKQEFFQLFSRILDPLRQEESQNYGPALEIYYSVATLFMRIINTYHLTEQLAFRMGLYKLFRLDEHEDWAAAVDYLYQLACAIFSLRTENADRCISDAVLFVQKHINEHLDEDLTLITLADLVHLNPSYLSRLFKERTRKNLYDYILEMRMVKAQELLRNSMLRVQEIAVAVGYESAQSFTRVFRKAVGKTPSEYRD